MKKPFFLILFTFLISGYMNLSAMDARYWIQSDGGICFALNGNNPVGLLILTFSKDNKLYISFSEKDICYSQEKSVKIQYQFDHDQITEAAGYVPIPEISGIVYLVGNLAEFWASIQTKSTLHVIIGENVLLPPTYDFLLYPLQDLLREGGYIQ